MRKASRTDQQTPRVSRETIKSEMAGTILKLSCAAGDALTSGQELLLMEAMKMEIPVLVPSNGTVVELLVAPGDGVVEGQDLAAINA